MINFPIKNRIEVANAPTNACFQDIDEFGRILNISINMELITSKINARFTKLKRFNKKSLKRLFSLSLRISNNAFATNVTQKKNAKPINKENEINFLNMAIRNAFFFGSGIDHK